MQILSRLQLPKTSETSEMYIKLDGQASIDLDAGKIILHQGDTLSFNTYFNSIYESFYTEYTTINEFLYQLKLVGDFEVSVYRERYGVAEKELICNQKIQNQSFSDYVELQLPQLEPNSQAGRIYIEITCLSEQGIFVEGLVATPQPKQRDISLAIITCTYKKEAYVTKTADLIAKDKLLQDKEFKIFVVDNGKTLNQSDFADSRVTLIPNRNVGGSGGFTRGLIEALQEDAYTHFLFMDDDIELDSEVVYKLFPLYENGKKDFAVAGTMLDFYQKHLLYEAGALYNKYRDDEGNIQNREFNIASLKQDIDLRDSSTLNLLLLDEEVDYGGFWFFAFSKEVVQNIGLPLPFFIKVDDIEFCLRVKEYLNNAITAFPSFAVWHEPFYAKNPVWDIYYCSRNMLIANTMHGSLKYWDAVKSITGGVFYHLLLFNYNTAKMYVKAFEDFLKGPSFLKENDSEILHTQITGDSKSHKSQTVVANATALSNDYQISKVGKVQKLISLLTLNGHLLPSFMIRDESVFINYPEDKTKRDSICKVFSKKRLVLKYKEVPSLYYNELDNQAAFDILSAWAKTVIKSTLGWSNITKQWQKSAKEFTSMQFWQKYLQPRT
jgi:galactofuranosylgalactofuranosylrhamnosyl-N-acetylglucosaminyl-diphospho-decaprenol beta-1,5/1,6-galactofuranosyltransferase